MSINSYYARSQQFTHYFGDYLLNLFVPQLQRCHSLLMAVSHVSLEIWVVGCAPVDQSLLERLDYILSEVLLDAKD